VAPQFALQKTPQIIVQVGLQVILRATPQVTL
jgi:hypothetical protein